MPNVGIIIVTFNAPNLLVRQLEYLRRFCKDDYQVIIVDNSSDKAAAAAIKYHAGNSIYLRSGAKSFGGSESHAFAASLGYTKFKDSYDYLFFADHDLFPFKPFSVVEILNGKLMAGLGQEKSKTYFWPGCFMFNAKQVKDLDLGTAPGLDTGGGTWKAIEEHGLDNCVFLSESYEQNPYFNKSKYDFYSVIGEVFMHFVAASNWNKQNDHEERINSLFNVLEEKGQ